MVPRLDLELVPAAEPIRGRVTKFGGQPTWVAEPQWPLSRGSGRPMRFIAQVRLDEEVIGGPAGMMAFLFIADRDRRIEEYTQESGNVAVLLQPGARYSGPAMDDACGPSLYRGTRTWWPWSRQRIPCEYQVVMHPGEDPDSLEALGDMVADGVLPNEEMIGGNKLGGIPAIMYDVPLPGGKVWTSTTVPGDTGWRFVMQIDQLTSDLFRIDCDKYAMGYLFVSSVFDRAYLQWHA